MNLTEKRKALTVAVDAAMKAGSLMRRHRHSPKKITHVEAYDIKLELDVRSQKLIERNLYREFPEISLLGEEGDIGNIDAELRWVVDPIDGTVNYTYGIPYACVSIALQQRSQSGDGTDYDTLIGVIYDPFQDEIWTAIRGQKARLNGKPIQVSGRSTIKESIISVGFSKKRSTAKIMMPCFNALAYRARKIRIMGAAALNLAYVASGRMDAFIEYGVSLWDVAAGGLILECAGGEFWHRPISKDHKLFMIANNGKLRKSIARHCPAEFR